MNENEPQNSESEASPLTEEEAFANILSMIQPGRAVRRATRRDAAREVGDNAAAAQNGDQRMLARKAKQLKRRYGNPARANEELQKWIDAKDEERNMVMVNV